MNNGEQSHREVKAVPDHNIITIKSGELTLGENLHDVSRSGRRQRLRALHLNKRSKK